MIDVTFIIIICREEKVRFRLFSGILLSSVLGWHSSKILPHSHQPNSNLSRLLRLINNIHVINKVSTTEMTFQIKCPGSKNNMRQSKQILIVIFLTMRKQWQWQFSIVEVEDTKRHSRKWRSRWDLCTLKCLWLVNNIHFRVLEWWWAKWFRWLRWVWWS